LVGVFALSISEEKLHRILFVFVGFSAGSILGAAYFNLLPEAVERTGNSTAFLYIALGFVLFFFLERFIYWYHGHGHKSDIEERMPIKKFVYINIIGDAAHNFIDGMVIAVSFIISVPVGVIATLAVVFHELPQEIGDFGLLIYGGLTRTKALLFNFFSALTAIAGAVFSNVLSMHTEAFTGFLVAFAAGGFIYLAASELIPEIQREDNLGKSVAQFVLFVFGLLLVWLMGVLFV
jgi:zinc and cadmium transporter